MIYTNEDGYNITLREMIKKNEGYSDKPYRCSAKKLTIGWGHNLEAHGITKQIAELMLGEDIQRAYYDILDTFPQFYMYSQKRQVALIDLSFNLGKSTLLKFKKTIAAIRAEDWEEAAKELEDSKYYKQVGNRAKRNVDLIRRG